MSLKESIFDEADLEREPVDMSRFWPQVGTVYVSVMSGWDRDTYEWQLQDAMKDKRHITCLLLVRCLTDEKGERIFGDNDIEKLAKKNWKALSLLWDKASELNKLRESDAKELEKNSPARGAASSATSAGISDAQNGSYSPVSTARS